MRKLNARGEFNILLIPLILVVLILFGTGGFAYWSYNNMTKYRYHADKVAADAVKAANAQLTTQLNTQFAEQEKKPYKTFTATPTYGSFQVIYPKTWSSYIAVVDGNDPPVDGYFYPDVVPDTGQNNSGNQTTVNFALRIQIEQTSYAATLQQYQAQLQAGQVQIQPYTLPKVPSVVGSELTGQIQDQKTGTLIVLPVRGQTLEIWTEGTQFLPDFTKIILPNFTFTP